MQLHSFKLLKDKGDNMVESGWFKSEIRLKLARVIVCQGNAQKVTK